jgi:hypothetical protein
MNKPMLNKRLFVCGEHEHTDVRCLTQLVFGRDNMSFQHRVETHFMHGDGGDSVTVFGRTVTRSTRTHGRPGARN